MGSKGIELARGLIEALEGVERDPEKFYYQLKNAIDALKNRARRSRVDLGVEGSKRVFGDEVDPGGAG